MQIIKNKTQTRQLVWIFLVTLVLGSNLLSAQVQNRFPKPDFETGYQQPRTTTPEPRETFLEYLDILVLVITLSLATWFALKTRSRRHIFYLTIFSLLYFGFFREGCICSIGAIQNVVLSLVDKNYIIPVSALIFFILPLAFALFFGRTFCAAVCPLGAIQDLVNFKPMKMPGWLNRILSLLPYFYLGFAVLFAATQATFLICRLDPFVGFFRRNAEFEMLVFGACFLILGIFIGRPYCRFLCPYGVLLGWLSSISKRHVTITPDECIQCRLCEESCPFDAIQIPTGEKPTEAREKGLRRLTLLIILLPVFVFAGGLSLARMEPALSRMHSTVCLAERIQLEDSGQLKDTTEESRTFRSFGIPTAELMSDALSIKNQFYFGGWFLGGFLGLVIGIKLIGWSVYRSRKDYEPDRVACISCGRCFAYCPPEHTRLEKLGKETTIHEF